jgi:hypothetical protein
LLKSNGKELLKSNGYSLGKKRLWRVKGVQTLSRKTPTQ